MRGSRVSSCCRSPSMAARNGARLACAPSMKAEARPRRPIRCSRRTRGSVRADGGDGGAGAVAAVVVDEDGLPGDAGEHGVEAADQAGDIACLVQHGNDDTQLRCAGAVGASVGRREGGPRRLIGSAADGRFRHVDCLGVLAWAATMLRLCRRIIGQPLEYATGRTEAAWFGAGPCNHGVRPLNRRHIHLPVMEGGPNRPPFSFWSHSPTWRNRLIWRNRPSCLTCRIIPASKDVWPM